MKKTAQKKSFQLKSVAKAAVSLSLIYLAACAKVSPSARNPAGDFAGGIIGGTQVADNDPIAKTIVAIYDKEGKSLCTGSILSSSLIVTAAHCANQKNPRALVLIFGTKLPTAGSPKPILRQVTGLRVNQKYNQVMDMFEKNDKLDSDLVNEWEDISLLKFEGGLPPGYEPAHLMASNQMLRNGATVTLAGYGEIDGVKHIGSDGLRQTQVTIANATFTRSEVLMDQRQGRGACHGDSGGPAYIDVNGRKLLFGVTSRGIRDPKNNCSQFAVYTTILSQTQFLKQAALELSRTAPTLVGAR